MRSDVWKEGKEFVIGCSRISTSGHFSFGKNFTRFVAGNERFVSLGDEILGGAKGPGLFFILPCVDTIVKVDLRTTTFNVPPQEVRHYSFLFLSPIR